MKLADGKARAIQHMMATSFWHPDGTPMSAQQFMEMLVRQAAGLLQGRSGVRALWSVPDTRATSEGWPRKVSAAEQLAEMQRIIDAEKSDLFDVLAYVAYALPPLTREERAAHAKAAISTDINTKQQAFLDFVLATMSAWAWANSIRRS